jgi:hypothetical protein
MNHCTPIIALAAAVAMAGPANAATPEIKLVITGGVRPVIIGVTDLPSGTQLSFYVKKPWLPDAQQRLARGQAACEDNCIPAVGSDMKVPRAIVSESSFAVGPLSFGGNPFAAGIYPLEISIVPDWNKLPPEAIMKPLTPIYTSKIKISGDKAEELRNPSPLRTMTAVIENCQRQRRNTRGWTEAEQENYQHQGCWHKVEADNGASYQIDLGLIQDFGSGATTSVYDDKGGTFNMMNLKRWYFSCTGYFSILQNGGMGPSPSTYAPPRSVAARIGEIVCAGAHVKPR